MYPWPLASGKNGQQVVDVLQKNVELAGAVWSNGWCVDCETFQSVASLGEFVLLYLIYLSIYLLVICLKLAKYVSIIRIYTKVKGLPFLVTIISNAFSVSTC